MQRGGFFVAQIPQISRIFALLLWRFLGKIVYLCTQKRAKLLTQLAGRNVQTTTIMASVTSIPKPAQIIITLEDNALVADIKRALKMIRGVASVRVAKVDDDKTITPAMRQSINKARHEYAKGETITCRTPEEMQKYFDTL